MNVRQNECFHAAILAQNGQVEKAYGVGEESCVPYGEIERGR